MEREFRGFARVDSWDAESMSAEHGAGPTPGWLTPQNGEYDDLFQDLLIAQLVAEAREVWSRGVARRYVRREEVLASPRGRIDLAAMARSPAAQRVELPCIHHPRSSNVLLNQVLGAAESVNEDETPDAWIY